MYRAGDSSTTPRSLGKYSIGSSLTFVLTIYSDIVILDNHHKDPHNASMVISSKMIMEDFGGLEAIARELKTDLKKGIVPDTMDDRINDYGPNKF